VNEKEDKVKDICIAGILSNSSDKRHLVIAEGKIESRQNQPHYRIEIEGFLGIGSPIMYKVNE
jgi:hypothetical protein